jgi:hypothetical protein
MAICRASCGITAEQISLNGDISGSNLGGHRRQQCWFWNPGRTPTDDRTGIQYDNVAALLRELCDLEDAIRECRRLWEIERGRNAAP